MAHDFLSIYPAKLLEYSLAIGYLLLFIPFWRYVQGGRKPAVAHAEAGVQVRAAAEHGKHAGARAVRPTAPGWFHVPAGVQLHPGHTWARLEPDGLVAVGVDDFAHKLVGPARGRAARAWATRWCRASRRSRSATRTGRSRCCRRSTARSSP